MTEAQEELARFRRAKRQRQVRNKLKRLVGGELVRQLEAMVSDNIDEMVTIIQAGGELQVKINVIMPPGFEEDAPDDAPQIEVVSK